MYGPEPTGHWTSSVLKKPFKQLKPGARYAVVTPFTDFDETIHPAGEQWIFLSYSFLPHDDGLSLFVSLDDVHEWQIRMQWRQEAQGPVIDNLDAHIQPAQK